MRIAICDDVLQSRTHLEQAVRSYFVNKHYTLSNLELYSDALQLLAALSQKKYFDIIFLDIEMPGINGLECAEKIREHSLDTMIIFVTNHDQYVRAAFSVEAFDYIDKPVSCDKIVPVLDRCLKKYQALYTRILFTSNKQHITLMPKEIVYVESFRKEVVFHLISGATYKLTYKLGDCEKQLVNYNVSRCHLSYLINLNYINSIQDKLIFLKYSPKPITIGGRYREKFLDDFMRFQTQKRR